MAKASKAATAAPTTEEKPAPTTAVAVIDESANAIALMEQFAGAGFENQDSSFTKMAFLRALQGQSKQIVDGVPGAALGKIVSTSTDSCYDSLDFIAVMVTREFIQWHPRLPDGSGGGFVARHDPDSDLVKAALKAVGGKFGHPKTTDGDDLIETFAAYGLAMPPNELPFPAIIAFASTGIPHFQKWNGKAKNQQGDGSPEFRTIPNKRPYPIFAFVYRVSTVAESKGINKWRNITLEPANKTHKDSQVLKLCPDMWKAAIALYEEVKAGSVIADMASGLSRDDAPSGAGGAAGGSTEEIPF